MNVRLAAQVLSETTGKILKEYYPPDMHGTAEFCLKLDKFFDILNVRSRKEFEFKRVRILSSHLLLSMMRGFIGLKITFSSTSRTGKKALQKDQAISTKQRNKTCSCLYKLMKAY